MTYGLAGKYVAEVYFDHGEVDGAYGVGYGKRCVGVSSGVDDDSEALGVGGAGLEGVDNLSLAVVLRGADVYPGGKA